MDTSALIVLIAVVVIVIGVGLIVRQRRSPDLEVIPLPTRAPRFTLGAAVRRALGTSLDEPTWESLEEALLAADVGVEASADIVFRVRETRPDDPEDARRALAEILEAELEGKDRSLHLDGFPAVVLVVGVNGTGKTTSIAKLAKRFQDDGMTVTLAAADTFRAGAAEQLQTWGDRVGARVVHGEEGGDPASVAYDSVDSARARGSDVVIIDTAGRLHGKRNLMAELEKIHRVAGGDRVDEVLLVLDATAGQNGLTQVREFSETVPISGIVLTKLDGTARGGIVIAVERTLGVPVKFVGVGEGLDDLVHFDPETFVASLLE
ncbi:MAG TPA: signal recognition particle-docking protein FtsY [Acidimicrobiia bacterium]|nr:signal recognition particle-docking protein FtsY [Acidimicrobiia bacterium]